MTSNAGHGPVEARLRDIQMITDAAMSQLDDQDFLAELVDRVKAVLRADTAAVLLLDRSSGNLIATAAAGLEEEVRQGVRIPVGRGFAGRIAVERRPVILDHVDHSTVLNPILMARGIHALLGVPMVTGGRVNTSYQSPPTTPRPGTYRAASCAPLIAGSAAGSRLCCNAVTATRSARTDSDWTTMAARCAASWSRSMSSEVKSRGVSDPTCMTPITLPPVTMGTPSRAWIPRAIKIGFSTVE